MTKKNVFLTSRLKVNVIKTFFYVTDEEQGRVCVPDMPFQSSLIFASKVGAYNSGAPKV